MDHKEIKMLVENGRELKEFIEHKLPQLREEVEKSKYGIDKHRDGFSTGAKIQSLNIEEFCYSSFSGSYGDSSTYSDISGLNMIMLRDYFIKYLNIHKDEIMLGVAELMITEAKNNRTIALKELDDYKANLLQLLED
jgi:hypothetical protein